MMKSVQFGWELNNVAGNGADMFCKILTNITILGIEMDVAFMTTSSPNIFGTGGFSEVLCTAFVSPPHLAFTPGNQAYPKGTLGAPEFDSAEFYTPVPSIGVHGGMGGSGGLAAVILKTWVACPPIASASQRNVVIMGLNIPVAANDYLVFHMDHAGYAGDVEMQGVLFYEVAADAHVPVIADARASATADAHVIAPAHAHATDQ